jgi:hypothetical protein
MLYRVNTKVHLYVVHCVSSVRRLANYSEGVTLCLRVFLEQLSYTARNLQELLLTSTSVYSVISQRTISSHKIWVNSPQATNKIRANPWSNFTNSQHRYLPVTLLTQNCVLPVWLPHWSAGTLTAGWVGSLLNRLTRGFSNCGSWHPESHKLI